jgi:GAF domain-containing protein
MNDDSLRDAAIRAVSHYFLGDETMKEALTRIAELTVGAVPGTKFAGLTMMSDGKIGTPVFTHSDAPEIDQAEYDADEGPCLEALRTGRVVSVPSLRGEARWPAFVDAAVNHGILSTAAFPMFGPDVPVGVMNLYATRENGFGENEISTAVLMAEQAGFVLVNTEAFWQERELSDGLRLAMDSRSVIEQAKGIIMNAQHVSADEAFALLVKQSQYENSKLRAVAEAIVRATSRKK